MNDPQRIIFLATLLGVAGIWLMLPRGAARGRMAGAVLTAAALGLGASQLRPLGDWAADGLFYLLAGVTVVAALATVTFRNPVYCAIWFGMTLTGTAGLFLFTGAEFLAVATLVVYAGAILVTFLFVLMLAQPEGDAPYDRRSWEALLAAATGAVLVGILTMTLAGVLIGRAVRPDAPPAAAAALARRRPGAAARGPPRRRAVRPAPDRRGSGRHAAAGGRGGGGRDRRPRRGQARRKTIPARVPNASLPTQSMHQEIALLYDYLVVGAMLFGIGLVGFLSRRNMIVMFLSAEMMLQGVSVSLVAWGRFHNDFGGQMLVIFIIAVAACEAAIALALILTLFQRSGKLDIAAWQRVARGRPAAFVGRGRSLRRRRPIRRPGRNWPRPACRRKFPKTNSSGRRHV